MVREQLAVFVALIVGISLPPTAFPSDPNPVPAAGKQSQVRSKKGGPLIQGGYVHQFKSGLDQGGEFSVDRLFTQGGFRLRGNRRASVTLAIGYGYTGYDFSGDTGFAGLRPWGNIHSLRVGVPIRYRTEKSKWAFFGSPTIRFAAESGASLDDSMFGGVLAGFTYRFSDQLTLGPGMGVQTSIEDETDLFPILLVDWKITGRLSLSTGRGLAATRGPGLNLIWRANDRWQYRLGARYETSRFRLDDNGPAPNGVGEDRSLPVYVAASYTPTRGREVSFIAGTEFGGELRLDDQDGNRITEDDQSDSSPFAGVTFRIRF